MQIQIDPNIPANLPPEEIRDFQSFIQTALDGLTASAGGEVMTLGTGMFAGLALIVIVIAGVKIAFSGNIQPWEVVRLVIGIWIPWVMMQFYTTTIPGMSQTFPGMIAEGGNFLHEMLLGDIISSMQTELGDMVRAIAANMQTQAAQGNVIGILTGGVHAFITAVVIAIGAELDAVLRADQMLQLWAAAEPGKVATGLTVKQEISAIREALHSDDEEFMTQYGGMQGAVERYKELMDTSRSGACERGLD